MCIINRVSSFSSSFLFWLSTLFDLRKFLLGFALLVPSDMSCARILASIEGSKCSISCQLQLCLPAIAASRMVANLTRRRKFSLFSMSSKSRFGAQHLVFKLSGSKFSEKKVCVRSIQIVRCE